MLSSVLTAAVIGTSLVAARPAPAAVPPGPPHHQGPWHWGTSTAGGSWGNPTASAASGPQTPFKFPLSNGFPNIQVPSAALTQIEQQAHGTLPDGTLANHLAAGDITSFEAIAFNELFEVAFFTSLIENITNNVPGFEIGAPGVQGFVLEALQIVQAQEELHALGANGILTAAGSTPIQPCEYKFPSDSFDSAINFARTFTDVVLGTLQDVQNGLAVNGDSEYVGLIGAVIGQEGEQNGYYRTILDLNPSALPFLTRSTGPWAFSALNQMVIVPGSCPNANIINLPIFSALTVETQNIQAQNQNLQFSFTNNGTDTNSISLVYTNQQNTPIVEKVQNVQVNGDTVTFEAFFPFEQYIMNGLTIATVTNSAGPFTSADEVASATLFGPGLIEIN